MVGGFYVLFVLGFWVIAEWIFVAFGLYVEFVFLSTIQGKKAGENTWRLFSSMM